MLTGASASANHGAYSCTVVTLASTGGACGREVDLQLFRQCTQDVLQVIDCAWKLAKIDTIPATWGQMSGHHEAYVEMSFS
jgi:hypothetical protein